MTAPRHASPRRRRDSRIYRLAERLVSITPSLPELEAFATRGHAAPPCSASRTDGGRQHVFRGEGPLGDRHRSIDCRWTADGYEMTIAGIGRFSVSRDGGRVRGEPESGAPDPELFTEALAGPALILALALQGVWCLHASAVELDGRAVAFVGESGRGKSTLAGALPRLPGIGEAFRCLADDILPVTLAAGTPAAGTPAAGTPAAGEVLALPRFPQLKYRPDRQPAAVGPASLPVAAVYVLEADPGSSLRGVTAEPLTGQEAVLALVRHTVAARLFTTELLRRHTELCARLADRVPVRRWLYPRKREILPRLAENLCRRNVARKVRETSFDICPRLRPAHL